MSEAQLSFALDLLQKQAELFLSTNMLVLGAVLGTYLHFLDRPTRMTWQRFLACYVPPISILTYNVYESWTVVQDLLVAARVTDTEALLQVLAEASFGWDLVRLFVAAAWALTAVTLAHWARQPGDGVGESSTSST